MSTRRFLCALFALCSAGAPRAEQNALCLYPKASQVVEVNVTPETTEAFNAVAQVDTGPGAASDVVLEVDGAGRVLGRVACQRIGATLYFHVPGLTKQRQQRRFIAYISASDDERPYSDDPPCLRVQSATNTVAVANDYYSIDMDPGRGTFFPAVGLPGDEALADDVYLEDRLWDRTAERKGQWLRRDPAAVVRLVASGPLLAVFEVQAAYRHSSEDEPVADATYRYVCKAGTPLIAVTARAVQPKARKWNEHHFLHVSHRGSAYPSWATQRPPAAGTFVDSKKVWTGQGWSVMHNGRVAIGLVKTRGSMTLHDHPGGFCQYIRDWVGSWSETKRDFAGTVLIAPWQGHDAMTQVVGTTSGVRVTSSRTVDRSAMLAAKTPWERWALTRKLSSLPQWPGVAPAGKAGTASILRTGEWLLLHNRRCAALFHAHGGLMGLVDMETGHDFVRSTNTAQAWELQIGKAGEPGSWVASADSPRPTVAQRDVRGSAGLVFTWSNVAPRDGKALTVQTEWRLDRSGLRGRIRTQGAFDDQGLLRVRFPDVERIGTAKATDVAVPRGNWGCLRQRSGQTDRGGYPSGNWPMSFVGLTEGANSLYIAAEDGTAEYKQFTLTPGGRFHFELIPPDLGVPGKEYALGYDAVLQPVRGNWVDVAKRYRAYALEQVWCSKGALADRDDIPKRYRDGLYWFLHSGAPEPTLKAMRQARERFPVPLGVHWYSWHVIPFDNDYPHYNPAKPGFKEAVREIQAMGITVMPYINGRLWDSDTKDFPTRALPWATKDAKGQYYVEIYGSKQRLVPMCPYSKLWQDTMVATVDWLYNQEGVDGVYMDQIAAARPRVCMDPGHGHPLGGGGWWLEGYTKMLTRIQALTEHTGRQRLLTTENNAECYIHLIDAFLVWTPRYPAMVPLYAAVYSDRRLAFASRLEAADSAMSFAMKQSRDFLWGTQLGWLGTWLLSPGDKAKCDYMVRLAQARLALKEFLSYGEYLGAAQVHCLAEVEADWVGRRGKAEHVKLPAVEGALWRAPRGDCAIILTNSDERGHAADVAIPSGWAKMAASEIDPLHPDQPAAACTNVRVWRVLVPSRQVRVLRFSTTGGPSAITTKELPPLDVSAAHAGNDVAAATGMMVRGMAREVLPRRLASLRPVAGQLRSRSVSEWQVDYRLAREDKGCRLRLALPEGVWAQPSSIIAPTTLAADHSERVLLRGRPGLKGGAHQVVLAVERQVASATVMALSPRKEHRLSAAGPVTVDGDLRDWSGADWMVLDGKTGNHVAEGKWSGPKDLSGRAAAKVSGKTFYLAFEVTDDVHHAPKCDRSIWEGDCIQVDFDPYLDSGTTLDGNDIELALAITDQGPKVFFWTPAPKTGCRVAAKRGEGVTAYELALPVAYVTHGQGAVGAVGFSFTLNDADKSGSFEGWLEWTPGICGTKNPSAFGVLCAGAK